MPTLRAVAEQGNAEAQYMLAVALLEGGDAADREAAVGWLARAADGGDLPSATLLGTLFTGKNGVPPQYDRAVDYLTRSATYGDPVAQNNLAIMHFRGWGTPVNRVAAYFWATLAEKGGIAEARQLREAVAADLTPVERVGLPALVEPQPGKPALPPPAPRGPPRAKSLPPPVLTMAEKPAGLKAVIDPLGEAGVKAVPAPVEEAIIIIPMPQPPAGAGGDSTQRSFRAHIASVGTLAAAEAEWSRLRRVHRPLLDAFAPTYDAVDLGGGASTVRIYVGQFPSRPAAGAFCERLLASKGRCLVAETPAP